MSQASMQAYLNFEPKIPSKRLAVWRVVKLQGEFGMTIREIDSYLRWGLHRVSPRVSELVKEGLLKDTGKTREAQTVYRLGDGTPAKTKYPRKRHKHALGRIIESRPTGDFKGIELVIRIDDPLFIIEDMTGVSLSWK